MIYKISRREGDTCGNFGISNSTYVEANSFESVRKVVPKVSNLAFIDWIVEEIKPISLEEYSKLKESFE